jgi:DNA-binding CsgD family transcriptional regulator
MLKQKYVLWDSIDDGDIILQDSKNILGVAHGITIIEKLDNGNAFYNFGNTEKKPTEVNNYISHLDILNEFIYFFNEKAKFIINEAEKKRLILPRQSHDELIIHSNDPLDSKPTNLSKSLFVDDNYNVSISSRELECVEWYLKGKTAIEIALILCLSKRTIETHIENVKEKLQCRNLAQLGYLIAMIKYRNFGFIPHPYK